MRDDGFNLMVEEESSDTRVMTCGTPFVVSRTPVDLELLPRANLTPLNARDRKAIRSPPTRIDAAIGEHWDGRNHERSLLRLA